MRVDPLTRELPLSPGFPAHKIEIHHSAFQSCLATATRLFTIKNSPYEVNFSRGVAARIENEVQPG